jgi:inhibitor of KinA
MARHATIRFLNCGDSALTVEFGDTIDLQVNAQVLALADRLEASRPGGVLELVPTFRSLTIHYDPLVTEPQALEDHVNALLGSASGGCVHTRRFRIPVCYDRGYGIDLGNVSELTGLSIAQIIDYHCAAIYHVYAIGFLPGFPYLGDLCTELVLPRRQSPRLRVPAGSVAIAMAMTGIYPLESPGGWHLLGRTPVPLFDRWQTPPALLRPGDQVAFQPIEAETYDRLAAASAEHIWPTLQDEPR